MSSPDAAKFTFDPAQCPLLQGLSPEEQKLRMETHPVIRACIQSVEGEGEMLAPCRTARPKRPLPRRKPAQPPCPTTES